MKELFDEQKQEVTVEPDVANNTQKWWVGKKCSKCDSMERVHIMTNNGLAICEKCLTK